LTFYWGNFLLFAAPVGNFERWRSLFAEEVGVPPRVRLRYNLGAGHGLAVLRGYGVVDTNEEDFKRLRLSYGRG